MKKIHVLIAVWVVLTFITGAWAVSNDHGYFIGGGIAVLFSLGVTKVGEFIYTQWKAM